MAGWDALRQSASRTITNDDRAPGFRTAAAAAAGRAHEWISGRAAAAQRNSCLSSAQRDYVSSYVIR